MNETITFPPDHPVPYVGEQDDMHPHRTRRSPRPRSSRRLRPVIGWVVGASALAAALAVGVASQRDDGSRAVVPSRTSPSTAETELDVRGIPTWWTAGGTSPSSGVDAG